MYRDCYTMKLAYPCEADGCRCGSDCLRTRPDCNRIADEDSYSNCDVIPHIGLHRSSEYMPQHDAAHISGPEGRALHAAKLEVIVSGKKAVAAMTCPGAIPLKTALRVAIHDVAAETRV